MWRSCAGAVQVVLDDTRLWKQYFRKKFSREVCAFLQFKDNRKKKNKKHVPLHICVENPVTELFWRFRCSKDKVRCWWPSDGRGCSYRAISTSWHYTAIKMRVRGDLSPRLFAVLLGTLSWRGWHLWLPAKGARETRLTILSAFRNPENNHPNNSGPIVFFVLLSFGSETNPSNY